MRRSHAKKKMTDASESVYRDAVTKLRILLSASEEAAAMDGISDVTPVKRDFSGSADFLDEIGPTLTDPKPKRMFQKHRSAGAAKRSLFGGSIGDRHNSWRGLLHVDDDERTVDRSGRDFKVLVDKQEAYIKQLEAETRFCREQLSRVLINVKDVLTERDQLKAEDTSKALTDILGTVRRMHNNIGPGVGGKELGQELHELRIENEQLKRQVKHAPDENRMIEALKKENGILTETLARLRSDAEEMNRREAEAVEQVKRSVEVAEQVRMEKTEMEFEVNQLKMQVDRQQSRIRSLIEEQVVKVDEERSLMEQKFQKQLQQVRDESDRQATEVGRLTAEIERQQRVEVELRKQISERDRLTEDLRVDTEKRIGHLQLEMVNVTAARQQAEQEVTGLKLDLEHVRSDLGADRKRLEAEVRSVRARLTKAEEMLVAARQEALELAEAKAILEREVNLVRLNSDPVVRRPSPLPDDRRGGLVIVSKLEDLVQRQSRVIGELKAQCSSITDKLEETVGAHRREKAGMEVALTEIERKHRQAVERAAVLEAQCNEQRQLHEKICRRLEAAELDNRKKSDEVQRMAVQSEMAGKEKRLLAQELLFLQGLINDQLPQRDEVKGRKNEQNSSRRSAITVERGVAVSKKGKR